MNTIKEMMTKAHQISVDHGWWTGFEDLTEFQKTENIGNKILMMHSEISEAVEELRDPKRLEAFGFDITDIYYKTSSGSITAESDEPVYHPESTRDTFRRATKPEGLAKMNLPLEAALQQKLAYNEGREYRHGNKAL